VYKLELLGGEGLLISGAILLLPFVVLFVLVKLLPPWPEEPKPDAAEGQAALPVTA
jgi:hypothetical protein